MKRFLTIIPLIVIALFLLSPKLSFSDENRYSVVIEESFYVVKPENAKKFLKVYREKLYPFWEEMRKMGIITEEYKLYSQRVHTLDPLWTYKTVVKFPNYAALDKWLEMRDVVYTKLFPNEEGYKTPRKEIDLITVEHWDEFIREIPLTQ